MYESLNGKVALVTGGGSGIGRATSLAFARLGCKVVVSDMNGPGGLETVKLILETGGEAIFIPTNVTLASQVEALGPAHRRQIRQPRLRRQQRRRQRRLPQPHPPLLRR